ncbi:hypothetical protein [Halopiger goleimassiliensis]|uniref:hypothetical protein n=1 Tax=Halopiger goleimassiliensis TaxID=1293048 RepID=UPI0012B5760F|nr:hypothetical protein [Halopiger goleimassiliensis]
MTLRNDHFSRRNVLKSASVAGVGMSAIGVASGKSASEYVKAVDVDIEITEVTGSERERAIERAMSEEAAVLRDYIETNERTTVDWDSSTILKVEEELEDSVRYVVKAPAETTSGTTFIQYNGFDMLSDRSELEMATSVPDVIGFVGDSNAEDVNALHVERNEVVTESISSDIAPDQVMPCTEDQLAPDCGGGGGCGTCLVHTGVDCAPSWDCMVTIATSAGSAIKGCSSCVTSLSWQICLWCATTAFAAGITGSNCLGCEDTEWQCAPSDVAGTICG